MRIVADREGACRIFDNTLVKPRGFIADGTRGNCAAADPWSTTLRRSERKRKTQVIHNLDRQPPESPGLLLIALLILKM